MNEYEIVSTDGLKIFCESIFASTMFESVRKFAVQKAREHKNRFIVKINKK